MTKVALIIRFTPYYRTGVFNHLSTMEGIDLTLITNNASNIRLPQLDPGQVNFPYINVKAYSFTLFGRKIFIQPSALWIALWKRYKVIVVYNHMADLTSWLMLILGKVFRRKVILWGHGKGSIDREWEGTWVRKSYMKLASANIFYNYEAYSFWSNHLKLNSLFVAPNALDTNVSETLYRKYRDLCLARKNSLVFIGRLEPKKDPILVLKIIHRLTSNFPGVLLNVIGDGPQKTEMDKAIKELGIEENVKFFGELFKEEEIAQILLQSWATLIPTYAGLSIQHSMAYGVPVIIGDDLNDHGPEASLVVDNTTGLVCAKNDLNDFAKKITGLFEDEEQRKKLSENSLNLISSEYTVEKMANGFYQAIRFALS
jgi:glycosyltransferase involved in cell wall biosynthesis